MFDRLTNGWRLSMQALRVVKTDKKLMLFPLFSGVAMLLVMASFALPIIGTDRGQELINGLDASDPIPYLVAFLFYAVTSFVIVFFNTALIGCALKRFKGEQPTLGDGFRIALSRLPQITAWALLSAVVGTILRVIESRSELAGRIVAGFLGMAWSVVSYFAIPVLAVEGVGPVTALKRSAGIMRRTWGESLGAEFGTGIIGLVLGLVAIIPAIVGVASGTTAIMAIGIGITVVLMIGVALVTSTLNAVVIGVLYHYATEGQAPGDFDSTTLDHAFHQR